MMQRVPRSGRELLPPQAVDEHVDLDHPALRSASIASRACRFEPPTSAGVPPARTSNGPSSRISNSSCIHGLLALTSLAGSNARVKVRGVPRPPGDVGDGRACS